MDQLVTIVTYIIYNSTRVSRTARRNRTNCLDKFESHGGTGLGRRTSWLGDLGLSNQMTENYVSDPSHIWNIARQNLPIYVAILCIYSVLPQFSAVIVSLSLSLKLPIDPVCRGFCMRAVKIGPCVYWESFTVTHK